MCWRKKTIVFRASNSIYKNLLQWKLQHHRPPLEKYNVVWEEQKQKDTFLGPVRSPLWLFKGNLCCLVSDSILGYFILTPRYLAGLSSWIWKLRGIIWKELYERRQEEKMGGQYIFYILPLFLGSTTIQWVWKFFLNTNEMVASSSQGVKIC